MGRFLVAPAGLPPAVEACLTAAVAQVFADPAAQTDVRTAKRSLEPLGAADAAELARATVSRAGVVRPEIERALAKIRS